MPDMEKIIYQLEKTAEFLQKFGFGGFEAIRNAITLLKEQEAVEPIEAKFAIFGSNRTCSSCKKRLFPAGRYCPHCGRLVKWND